MRSYEQFLVLLAELDNDAAEIERVLPQNTQAWERIRNLYAEDLNPAKTTAVQQTTDRFFSSFPSMHCVFRASLFSIAEAVR